MRVIIAGSRGFSDYVYLYRVCSQILSKQKDIEIVSGGADGADKLGELFARDRGFRLKIFPADWVNLGKRAGYARNVEMAEYADALIAFWDGQSKGTKHMIDIAKRKGLKIRVLEYNNTQIKLFKSENW